MDNDAPSPVVCPHCGCRCGLIAFDDGCGLGREAPLADAPTALIDGKPGSLDEAVERAAAILAAARHPLVYGLTHLTCEAQRAAVALADRLGGVIHISGAASAALFPDIGTITCTLGEIKHRADLLLFWGGRSGLGEFPLSWLCGRGESCETILIEASADDFVALWLLRALIQGKQVDPALGDVAGMALADWRNLAHRLKSCKFGVLFLDSTSSRATEAANGVATALNAFTRFYVLTIPRPGNRVGAEQVLTWQTGYPAAVGLHCGYPRSFGSEFSAERLLAQGEADTVLLVGAGNLEELSPLARARLTQIPVVALSPNISNLPAPATVAITTNACANPGGGTAFRFDGLALPLRSATSYSFPDDFQVLQRIEQALGRSAALR